MDLIACTDTASTAVLAQAILLYSPGGGNSRRFNFATVHEVVTDAKQQTIMPGEPLSADALADALGALAASTSQRRWQPIDTRVVASGHGMLAWWSPAQVRHLHFHDDAQPSGAASQPAMFWVAVKRSLYIFCLETNERPSMDTKLMNSVHFNVFNDGKVCLGSSVMPADLEPALYEQMFYESRFTHPHGVGWQVNGRGGAVALWKRLVKASGAKPFPAEVMKPAGFTVEQALDAICGVRGE